MRWCGTAITVALALVATSGCKARVMTARNSVHPVMLGPTTSIGGRNDPPPKVSRWATRVETSMIAATDQDSTTSQQTETAAGATDFDVYFAAQDRPHAFTVDALRCRGFAFSVLVAVWMKLECSASGDMREATRWAGGRR